MRQDIIFTFFLSSTAICDIVYYVYKSGGVFMQYDKNLVAHKLRRWDKFITD